MPKKTIQNIFRCYESYLRESSQPLKNRKAIDSITRCRTGELGTSYFSCHEAHDVIEQHHFCRHRSCSLCANKQQHQWVEKQKTRLLNTAHFHVVFTLPHEYQALWLYNEREFASLLFKASREVLMTLMGDPKHHGVEPGLVVALHTWGRQLTLHPHTHCLVTAGGLNKTGDWQDTGEYLLPIKLVKQLYRGKLQSLIKAAYEAKRLALPTGMSEPAFLSLYRRAYKKEWSVRIEERYEHGKGVMLYLSRYFRGGPLKPSQITEVTSQAITFRYLDHRDKRTKVLALSPGDWLRRLLWHVPPQGLHTVRHYGLYAGCAHKKRAPLQAAFGTLEKIALAVNGQLENMVLSCKTCGQPADLIFRRWRRTRKAFSLNKAIVAPGGFVQQDDEADIANGLRLNSS